MMLRLPHFAGLERGSHVSRIPLNHRCERMRAAEHAPRDPSRALDRRYGLAEIVERRTIGVVGARLDGLRDGLLVFFVCIILFRVAAAVYSLTDLLVAAAPVVVLAS